MGWEDEVWQKGRLLSRVSKLINFIELVRLRAASVQCRTLFLPHERVVRELAERAFGVGAASLPVVHAIGNVARRGNAIAVAAVKQQLDHPEVREEALLALGLLAHRGDTAAVLAAVAHLEDKNPRVRRAAVATVGDLASEGDPLFVSRAAKRFEDEDVKVRETALRAIISLVGADTEDTNAVLCQRLRHESMQVRHAAAVALGKVAESGDVLVALALANCAQDSNQEVRRAVVPALGAVAERGDLPIISGLLACLEDDDVVYRQNAVTVIMHLAKKGDKGTVQLLRTSLRHDEFKVREAVALMLGKLANVDDPKVIAALEACALNSDEQVRSAVKVALEGVIREVDASAISALASVLRGLHPDARRAEVQAFLRKIELDEKESREKEHRDALFAVGLLLENEDQTVREIAICTLEAIVDKGHVFGTSETGTLIWEMNPQVLHARQTLVRRLAVCLCEHDFLISYISKKLIPIISKSGDPATIQVVLENVQHEMWQVRLATWELLTTIARGPDDGHVVHLAIMSLKDESSSVREQALALIRGKHHLSKADKLMDEVGEFLAADDMDTRDAAVDALHALAPLSTQTALRVLRSQLEHRNWHVRQTSVSAWGRLILAGILPCEVSAFRRIEALLSDDSWLVRNAAAATLGGMIELSRSDGACLAGEAMNRQGSSPMEDVEAMSSHSHRVSMLNMRSRSSLSDVSGLMSLSRPATRQEGYADAVASAVAALRTLALEDVDCRVQQAASDILIRVSMEEVCVS